MILQAYELGLGTCWIGAFKEDAVRNILKIPKQARVVAMTPLGYPDEPPSPKDRKSLDQIVCFEKYG
jgi:nitroreductase